MIAFSSQNRSVDAGISYFGYSMGIAPPLGYAYGDGRNEVCRKLEQYSWRFLMAAQVVIYLMTFCLAPLGVSFFALLCAVAFVFDPVAAVSGSERDLACCSCGRIADSRCRVVGLSLPDEERAKEKIKFSCNKMRFFLH